MLRVAEGRGGSRWLHDALAPGQEVEVGAPRSAFAPPAAARHHLLVGAGIGLTPFLSYVAHFERRGISYELHHVHRAGYGPHAAALGVPPGWLAFGDLPDLATLAGGAIIAAGGLLSLSEGRKLSAKPS